MKDKIDTYKELTTYEYWNFRGIGLGFSSTFVAIHPV